ncbi:hypothetical protein [Pontibacter chitinilyticus]|uniref:hypothetical protein n=1 Tax=Pontibacter chitinilyticus TaxID=2674989 RepID=UPI003218EE71
MSVTESCHAQAAAADTAFLSRAQTAAEAAYHQAVGVQTHLYNGTEYIDYRMFYLEGNQFFASNVFTPGDIYYDGAWFRQTPLLYDVVKDEVVTIHNSSGKKITLITAKVDTFLLHGHLFVRYAADSTAQASLPKAGFYDVLYNKDVRFLVRRSKNIQERATQGGMEGEFRNGDKLYLWKDGAYYQVSSKKSVLNVLKDKKKQLRKYASAHHLKFGKQREGTILALTQYYDSLSDGRPADKTN